MLCDRCSQTFCDKHVIEHRQQSAHQLDHINTEHDLIKIDNFDNHPINILF